VPQLVWVQPGHADGGRCDVEAAVAEHRYPQRTSAAHTAEHQVVGVLAGDVRREVLDEEPRDRHLSTLMALGRAAHQALALTTVTDWVIAARRRTRSSRRVRSAASLPLSDELHTRRWSTSGEGAGIRPGGVLQQAH